MTRDGEVSHRCEFHAVGFKRERGGEVGGGPHDYATRAISRARFEQVEADVAVDQAVAHAVGERLAEIISVADVRRIGAQSHNVMGCAAHGMRVRREVAPSQAEKRTAKQPGLSSPPRPLSRPCELYLGARGILLRADKNLGSDI